MCQASALCTMLLLTTNKRHGNKKSMFVLFQSGLAVACDPLGSSGDGKNCMLCNDVKIICNTFSVQRLRFHANRVCNEDIENDDHRQWLKSLACDASKISHEAASIGFETLNSSIVVLDADQQLMCLQKACTLPSTRHAFHKVCGTPMSHFGDK
jgi:hypothetical protein